MTSMPVRTALSMHHFQLDPYGSLDLESSSEASTPSDRRCLDLFSSRHLMSRQSSEASRLRPLRSGWKLYFLAVPKALDFTRFVVRWSRFCLEGFKIQSLGGQRMEKNCRELHLAPHSKRTKHNTEFLVTAAIITCTCSEFI